MALDWQVSSLHSCWGKYQRLPTKKVARRDTLMRRASRCCRTPTPDTKVSASFACSLTRLTYNMTKKTAIFSAYTPVLTHQFGLIFPRGIQYSSCCNDSECSLSLALFSTSWLRESVTWYDSLVERKGKTPNMLGPGHFSKEGWPFIEFESGIDPSSIHNCYSEYVYFYKIIFRLNLC